MINEVTSYAAMGQKLGSMHHHFREDTDWGECPLVTTLHKASLKLIQTVNLQYKDD